jgi:rubrerythrin
MILTPHKQSADWFWCENCLVRTYHVLDKNGNWQCPGCGKITYKPLTPPQAKNAVDKQVLQ